MLEIFLDMDGVLADLRRQMYTSWSTNEYDAFDGPYPFMKGGAKEEPFEQWYGAKERWTTGPVLNPEFWEMIPQYPWSQSLYFQARQLGNVHICSNPGRPEFARSAAYGKMAWCASELRLKPAHVILMRDKYLLARSNRILIDDDEDNITKWREHGGTGILFPQPWNKARQFVSDDQVAYCMNILNGEEHA